MAKELILGLGGTGVRIVSKVAKEIASKGINADGKKISCAVIDTNDYDIHRLKDGNAEVFCLNISKNKTVGECINEYKEDAVEDWMPMSMHLGQQSMADGSGQMRAKARLAFYDCLKDGTIRELETELDKLIFNLDGQKVNVVIVSSLAGGTGSGILVQAVMWLRQYFAYHEASATVTGILILPDVFIRTIAQIGHDEAECRVLRANAYATIREINAISKSKTASQKLFDTVKLDEVGYSSDNGLGDKPVFDRTYLIDYEVKTGSAFMSIADYENMVAHIVCESEFGPIGNDLRSVEDNLFVRLTRSDDPLYGSCGIARAVYPYESVLEYCALRATKGNLVSGWKKIDQYVDAIIEHQKKHKDDALEFVGPRKEYVRQFDALSNDDEAKDKLFYKIRHDVMNEVILEEDGRCIVRLFDKIRDFRYSFDQKMRSVIEDKNPGNLFGIKIRYERKDWVDNEYLCCTDDLKCFVVDKRKNVERFVHTMDTNVDCLAKDLADSICPIDMGEVNAKIEGTILNLFTKKDEDGRVYFIHPIAIRCLLYRLKDELEEKRKTGTYLDRLHKRLLPNEITKKYEEEISYFDKVKTDVEEDALTYLDKKPWFMTEDKFIKKYKELYYYFNEKQFQDCCSYAEYSLVYATSSILCERIEVLIKIVEDFFNSFDDLCDKIDCRIGENIEETENANQQVIYVCSSKEDKERIYDSLNLITDNINQGVNETVAKAFYEQLCAKANPEADYNKKYVGIDICEIFANKVINTYKKAICDDYSEEIDVDLYTALCKHSDFEYRRENGQLEEKSLRQQRYQADMEHLIDALTTGGAPFLNTRDDEISATITAWGFNPELVNACPELGHILGVNVETQKNEAYGKNELICCSEIVGVAARNIDKFNEMNTYNSYYASYEKIVNMMNESASKGKDEALVMTPHIDKTWHKILPFISPDKKD